VILRTMASAYTVLRPTNNRRAIYIYWKL